MEATALCSGDSDDEQLGLVYAYTLSVALPSPGEATQFEPVAQTRVDPDPDSKQALADGLYDWALGVLRNQQFDIGLYTAEFATLDEDNYPDILIHREDICWNPATH